MVDRCATTSSPPTTTIEEVITGNQTKEEWEVGKITLCSPEKKKKNIYDWSMGNRKTSTENMGEEVTYLLFEWRL